MRKLGFCMLLIAILMTSMSCKKDKNEPEESGFTAKIDGSLWTAKTVLAFKSMNGTTQISASGDVLSDQVVIMFNGAGIGTYLFNDNTIGSVAIGSNVFTTLFADYPEGKIIITEYDEVNGKISGTFEFEGEDIDGTKHNITEGKISNVKLAIQ